MSARMTVKVKQTSHFSFVGEIFICVYVNTWPRSLSHAADESESRLTSLRRTNLEPLDHSIDESHF